MLKDLKRLCLRMAVSIVIASFYLPLSSDHPKADDASAYFTIKWYVNGNEYAEGDTADIPDDTSVSFEVRIYNSSNQNVTSDFKIGHAFWGGATSVDTWISASTDDPGSYGEKGKFWIPQWADQQHTVPWGPVRVYAAAYKASTEEYITGYFWID